MTKIPLANAVLTQGSRFLGLTSFYLLVSVIAAVAFFGLLVLGVLLMITLPRLLRRAVRPGTVYPLYGPRYLIQLMIGALTNSALLVLLLGDSSFIVAFMRALGYRLTPVVQTGSNFGTQHVHDSPYLTTVGTGTVISDGLSVLNMEVSNTAFRVNPVVIGERNFLGNNIAFPARAKTGNNVLLATKVMVPIDGPIRENVGLLGSPSFEIPRTNSARAKFSFLDDPDEVGRRLIRKNWYNAGTLALALASLGVQFLVMLQLAAVTLALYQQHRVLAITAAMLVTALVLTTYGIVAERASMGFRRLRPRHCSIYDRYFWAHERLWKFYTSPMLVGTPFQNVLWRLAGVRIGRRVFDDGAAIPEKSLVTIGDDVVLNAGSVIQNHSLEDGIFTSDYTVIGAGATVGTAAFVHLGVTMGPGSVLDADAFLMKGAEMAAHTSWVGNPAAESRSCRVIPARRDSASPVLTGAGRAVAA
jgi:non-ribosomal peptide synthetase-like protein